MVGTCTAPPGKDKTLIDKRYVAGFNTKKPIYETKSNVDLEDLAEALLNLDSLLNQRRFAF